MLSQKLNLKNIFNPCGYYTGHRLVKGYFVVGFDPVAAVLTVVLEIPVADFAYRVL